MSLLPTHLFRRPVQPRPSTSTPVIVRDAFVPGERFCGVDITAAIAEWTRPRPVFVTARALGGGYVSLAVLRFDRRGFGMFRAEVVPVGGPMSAALRSMASSDAGVVTVHDGSRAATRTLAALGVDALCERSAADVEAWERGTTGIVRDTSVLSDLTRLRKAVVRDGDIIAAEAIADLARADVIALVALGDTRVVVH